MLQLSAIHFNFHFKLANSVVKAKPPTNNPILNRNISPTVNFAFAILSPKKKPINLFFSCISFSVFVRFFSFFFFWFFGGFWIARFMFGDQSLIELVLGCFVFTMISSSNYTWFSCLTLQCPIFMCRATQKLIFMPSRIIKLPFPFSHMSSPSLSLTTSHPLSVLLEAFFCTYILAADSNNFYDFYRWKRIGNMLRWY